MEKDIAKKHKIYQFKYKPQYFKNQLPMDTEVLFVKTIILEAGSPEITGKIGN